jgi:hypothetical protein
MTEVTEPDYCPFSPLSFFADSILLPLLPRMVTQPCTVCFLACRLRDLGERHARGPAQQIEDLRFLIRAFRFRLGRGLRFLGGSFLPCFAPFAVLLALLLLAFFAGAAAFALICSLLI